MPKVLLVAILCGCVEGSGPEGSGPEAPIFETTVGSMPVEPLEPTDPCMLSTPCVISFTEPTVPTDAVVISYRMCCPVGSYKISILEVSGKDGNWGDVTRWGLCTHMYSEEFVHPNRLPASPWAILSVYDGNGGDITSCRTANAPPEVPFTQLERVLEVQLHHWLPLLP